MSHFAEISNDRIVVRVVVFDGEGIAGEAAVAAFMASVEGVSPGVWKQTSYTGSIRGCFAGEGFIYDPDAEEFVAPYTRPSDVTPLPGFE